MNVGGYLVGEIISLFSAARQTMKVKEGPETVAYAAFRVLLNSNDDCCG